ncbi:hypothetical protein DCPSUM001_14230 [Dysgonomonas capnocytophagoides]|uniref:hypothetical protein n=1 Tax=Dysgonomonas capnocytophagoides TaxID=45254 RepID=UPI00292058A7|nr:hypothetical protein DCPSUM001_14230 [Dysgonomonas capnocytophagoides]
MRKYYILSALIMSTILSVSAQVGINIQSPVGVFHINPKADTSTADDVIVTEAGNMGLGTTSPQAKLHINASTSETALRIVDGSQKSDRVLVSADATGGVTWGAIKGSGGETFVSSTAQSFAAGTGAKLYLSGTNTKYIVTGEGPYLVYFRWWGRASVATGGRTSTYVRLMKNGVYVDTVEYYIATAANTPFALTVALVADCSFGDYLEVFLSPGSGTWTSAISPVYTRTSVTFFLM